MQDPSGAGGGHITSQVSDGQDASIGRPDSALVTSGDDFEQLYRSAFASVFRAVRLASRDAGLAEEATQEAFARAYARWDRLAGQPWVAGWVMRTALNVVRRRKRWRVIGTILNDASSSLDSAARVDLDRALAGLPNRQKTAIFLYYLADLPIRDVATIMRSREGTVKALLAHGRSRLASVLQAED